MVGRPKIVFEFEEFRLIPEERLLLMNGAQIQLPIKAFDILVVLVENAGDLVTKSDLLQSVWPDSFVEEANIQVQISAIRKALNANGKGFIETVPRQGYRFTATVARRNLRSKGDDALNTETSLTGSNEVSMGSKTDEAILSSGAKINRYGYISIAFISLAILSIGSYWLWTRQNNHQSLSGKIQLSRLTDSGKAFHGALSPDGNRIAYKYFENGLSTLMSKDIQTTSERVLLPASNDLYGGLTFSPDGRWLYYLRKTSDEGQPDLFKIPSDGGPPAAVKMRVNSKITFSPDGKRFAFIRGNADLNDIVIVNTDGTDEQIVPVSLGDIFSPAWSPDGKSIAFFKFDDEMDERGNRTRLYKLDLEDKSQTILDSKFWGPFPGTVLWLKDGSGLLIAANDNPQPTRQLWYVDVANGTEVKLTNDFNDHSELSIDEAGDKIVASDLEEFAGIWKTSDHGDFTSATQITNGANQQEGYGGIAWAKINRIIYTARVNGYETLWAMNTDGSDRVQLTSAVARDDDPTVDGDGRRISFASDRSGGPHLWQVTTDGRRLVQLSNGQIEQFGPQFTPDGKFILYNNVDQAHQNSLWRMNVDGSDQKQISDLRMASEAAQVSRDGQFIAFYFDSGNETPKLRIAILPSAGGEPIRILDVPPTVQRFCAFRWVPDGSALTYVECKSRACNLWNQPIDGQKPYQITRFDRYDIPDFDWSPDGSQIAVVRSYETNNLILISGMK